MINYQQIDSCSSFLQFQSELLTESRRKIQAVIGWYF